MELLFLISGAVFIRILHFLKRSWSQPRSFLVKALTFIDLNATVDDGSGHGLLRILGFNETEWPGSSLFWFDYDEVRTVPRLVGELLDGR